RRKALAYPPFATLVRVICAAADRELAHAAAAALREAAAAERGRDPGRDPRQLALLGPAPLFMLRGRSRYQLVLKAAQRATAISAVSAAVDAVSAERRYREVALSVDVDPQ
ncbi:MAG: hypothetical protein KGL16_07920, partial [Acidobacteriota bacterium]|nr:hypothetical protein [Acidobacteriota bacterium]